MMKKRIVLIMFLFVLLTFSTNGQVINKPEIIEVTLCDLQNNPDKFIGKTLRVKALYTASFESSWLSPISQECKNNAVFSNLDFDKQWRSNSHPNSIVKLEKGLRIKNGKMGERRSVKIKFVGKFDFVKTNKNSSLPAYRIEILFLE